MINCHSLFPKAQDDDPKDVVLCTTQRYSVYGNRGVMKPEDFSHLRRREFKNNAAHIQMGHPTLGLEL